MTTSSQAALSLDGARRQVGQTCFAGGAAERVGRVGIESEFFVLRRRGDRPAGRMPLAGPEGIWAVLDGIVAQQTWLAPADDHDGVPAYPLVAGGQLTFEPGGQLEYSSAARDSLGQVLADWEAVVGQLRRALAARGLVLASLGLDPWHDLSEAPLQLAAPRYRCMDEHYAYRGSAGAVMMRNTASCQVNLDLGPAGERAARFLLANLVSPWLTASFAASPAREAASARARTWQLLDPTRTGFPRLADAGLDPRQAYVAAALDADVMVFREQGPWEGAAPGYPFRRWIREGHSRHGRPSADDLDYHLTTLFFEVRPRGFLEFRAPDALPPPWHGVPAVFLSGLFYGAGNVERALTLLTPVRDRLPELWRRAAGAGLADPELGRLAPLLWTLALEGAERLPPGYLRPQDLARAVAYMDRFPARRRMPADDLRETERAHGTAGVLCWATGDQEEDHP